MKNRLIIMVATIFLMVFTIPAAFAWDDCPFGLVDDPYPGECGRYVDTDDNGICDHSESAPEDRESSAPVATSTLEPIVTEIAEEDVSTTYFVTSFMSLTEVVEMYEITPECFFSHIKSRFEYTEDITGEETVKTVTQATDVSIEKLQALAQQIKDGDEVELMKDFDGQEYPLLDEAEEPVSSKIDPAKKNTIFFIVLLLPIIFMSTFAVIKDIFKKKKK